MTTSIQRRLAALCISLAASLPAAATTYSVDFTDMWFNSAESGWGVNVIQQSDMIFATLFVYGADNTPRWYVTGAGLQGSGGSSFSGALYSTTGPYFAGSFNPAAVGNSVVGSMTLSFSGPYNGTMTYTVNGVSVTKSITRQPIRSNNLTGHYLGGVTANGSACTGVPNGPILIFDNLNVTQSGSTVAMTVTFNNSSGVSSTCTFNGTYTPQGRLGSISGNFSCNFGTTPGNAGTFTLNAVDAGAYGFSSSFSGHDQFCTYAGQFGGVKDIQ
jgi:hypothetical protein